MTAAVGRVTGIPSWGGGGWLARVLVGVIEATALAIGIGAVLVLHPARPGTSKPSSHGTSLPSPNRGLIGILRVLRRPQTSADLDRALVQRALLGPGAGLGIPVMSEMRLATVTPWAPSSSWSRVRPPTSASIAKMPPAFQAIVKRRVAQLHWTSGLRLMQVGYDTACCATAAQIEDGQAWGTGGAGSLNYVMFVVPDGVARVTIGLPHPVDTAVHGNIAAFEVPQPVENPAIYPIVWYGPNGSVVKRFPSALPPTPTPAQASATRARELRQAERAKVRIATAILHNFTLFGTAGTGSFGSGATGSPSPTLR